MYSQVASVTRVKSNKSLSILCKSDLSAFRTTQVGANCTPRANYKGTSFIRKHPPLRTSIGS